MVTAVLTHWSTRSSLALSHRCHVFHSLKSWWRCTESWYSYTVFNSLCSWRTCLGTHIMQHKLTNSLKPEQNGIHHYNDAIMGAIASQITSLASVYSTVELGDDQRKHQSSASLAFVRGIHRRPVNSPHKGPVTREKFPFDDVIMFCKPYFPMRLLRKIVTSCQNRVE